MECGHGYHVVSSEWVPVPPDPEGWGEDGDPLTNINGEVSIVVRVGTKWLLCCRLDAAPGCVRVEGDPAADLGVWGTVPLCGPGADGGAGEVPDTAFGDGVGNGQQGVVDGVAVGFGRDEDQWAL